MHWIALLLAVSSAIVIQSTDAGMLRLPILGCKLSGDSRSKDKSRDKTTPTTLRTTLAATTTTPTTTVPPYCTVTDDIRENGTLPYIETDGYRGNTSGDVLLKTGDQVNPETTIYVDECTPCQCTDQGSFNCTPIDSGWNNYSRDCLAGFNTSPCLPNDATWSYPGDDECHRHTCVNGTKVYFDLKNICTCDPAIGGERVPEEFSPYPYCCICTYQK